MMRYPLLPASLALLLLVSCGGDTRTITGPAPIAQFNCPRSGAGAGFASGSGAQFGVADRVRDARTGTTCPTCCSTCQAKHRSLQGVPTRDNSVGDTKIVNTIDCGDLSIVEPTPTSPVVLTPVIITP